MVIWVEIAGFLALSALAMGVLFQPRRLTDLWERHVRPRLPRRPTPGVPVERLAADLHRLALDLERIERSNPPAKMARLRATSMAYDDVLLAACRALDVQVDTVAPLDPVARLETEAALAQQGLHW